MSTEKTIQSKVIYKGKILDLIVKDVLLDNQKIAKREVVNHQLGVSIVASNGKEIFLVKQFRTAIEKEILEIPAGLVEEGEDIEKAAHRELQEEIGYDAKKMRLLTKFYPSPGFCNEVTYVYLAEDLFLSKLPEDEDEFIKVETLPIHKISDFIHSNEYIDAKTVIGLSLFLLEKNV